MYQDPKTIYNEANSIVKSIPKVCDLCYGKLERVSKYSDVIMRRQFNPLTGRRDGKIYFVDLITDRYKDRNNYQLWCKKCSLVKEVIISYKSLKNNKKRKIIQVM